MPCNKLLTKRLFKRGSWQELGSSVTKQCRQDLESSVTKTTSDKDNGCKDTDYRGPDHKGPDYALSAAPSLLPGHVPPGAGYYTGEPGRGYKEPDYKEPDCKEPDHKEPNYKGPDYAFSAEVQPSAP